jgi:hypothetical protein
VTAIGVQMMQPNRALTVAHAAATIVEGPARVGSVHSVFRRAANLWILPDALLAITGPMSTRVPNGIVVDSARSRSERFLGLCTDMTVRAGHGYVEIAAAGLRIDTVGALRWDPRPRFPSRFLDAAGLQRNLDQLAWLIRRDAGGKPWSFASLLDASAHHVQATRAPIHHDDAQHALLMRRARPAVAALLAAVKEGNTDRISAAARRLAGLGRGLTPSGDDFLIGVCGALVLADAMLPVSRNAVRFSAASRRDLALAIAAAADQTTMLSAVWLRHAAHAEFSSEVGRVLVTLADEDASELQAAVTELLAVGAESGLDTATGLLHGGRAMLSSLTSLPRDARPLGHDWIPSNS